VSHPENLSDGRPFAIRNNGIEFNTAVSRIKAPIGGSHKFESLVLKLNCAIKNSDGETSDPIRITLVSLWVTMAHFVRIKSDRLGGTVDYMNCQDAGEKRFYVATYLNNPI
jgi:hypothetical protein